MPTTIANLTNQLASTSLNNTPNQANNGGFHYLELIYPVVDILPLSEGLVIEPPEYHVVFQKPPRDIAEAGVISTDMIVRLKCDEPSYPKDLSSSSLRADQVLAHVEKLKATQGHTTLSVATTGDRMYLRFARATTTNYPNPLYTPFLLNEDDLESLMIFATACTWVDALRNLVRRISYQAIFHVRLQLAKTPNVNFRDFEDGYDWNAIPSVSIKSMFRQRTRRFTAAELAELSRTKPWQSRPQIKEGETILQFPCGHYVDFSEANVDRMSDTQSELMFCYECGKSVLSIQDHTAVFDVPQKHRRNVYWKESSCRLELARQLNGYDSPITVSSRRLLICVHQARDGLNAPNTIVPSPVSPFFWEETLTVERDLLYHIHSRESLGTIRPSQLFQQLYQVILDTPLSSEHDTIKSRQMPSTWHAFMCEWMHRAVNQTTFECIAEKQDMEKHSMNHITRQMGNAALDEKD